MKNLHKNLDKLDQLILRGQFQTLFLMGIRFVSLISKFVLTIFIARYMGFETLGIYGLVLSATFVVPDVVGLGIMFIRTRNAVTQPAEEIVKRLYYYYRHLAYAYGLILLLVALYVFWQGNAVLAFAILFVIVLEHINNDFYNLLLNLSKPLAANILHFIRTTVWIFVFIAVTFIFPFLHDKIEYLLMAWVVGDILSLVGFFVVTKQWPWRDIPTFEPFFLWVCSEFKVSKTIYANNVMTGSSTYLNHFLVAAFLGLELTGVYVYFFQIMGALCNLIKTGVVQVTAPKLVRAFKEKTGELYDLYKSCMKQGLVYACIMSLVAGPAMYFITLHIVDRPLAIEWFSIMWFNLVIFIFIIATEINQIVLYSHHRDDLMLKLSLIDLCTIVIFSALFIPLFGLWGACVVLFAKAVIRNIMQFYFIKHLKAALL